MGENQTPGKDNKIRKKIMGNCLTPNATVAIVVNK